MKHFSLFVACSILALGLAGCGKPGPTHPTQQIEWEYRFVGANLENLRAVGSEGWGAFAIDQAEDGGKIVWLKRPLSGDHP